MDVKERNPGDRSVLAEKVRHERDAVQRDRWRAIGLALDGELTEEIVRKLDRCRAFVQRWVYAYRDGGLDAIRAGTAPGATPKLAPEQTEAFRKRVLAGPTEADGVCTLRGLDLQRILREEFGAEYSLSGVYLLLHRLGFSSLVPRPKHRKTDFQAQEEFKQSAPLLGISSDGKHRVATYPSGSRMSSEPASKAR
jgi:transposase